MIARLVDFIVGAEDDDHTFSEKWLKVMVVIVLAILIPLCFYITVVTHDRGLISFAVASSLLFGWFYWLLLKSQTRLVAMLFSLGCLTTMLTATYAFGGVNSTSYFGLVLALIIIGMFTRTWLLATATFLSIVLGGYLVWAEAHGLYQALENYNTDQIWASTSLIFILAAIFVNICRRVIRQQATNEKREIRERLKTEQALRKQEEYFNALREATRAIIHRHELLELLDTILKKALALTDTENAYIDILLPGSNKLFQIVGYGKFAELGEFVSIRRGEGVGGTILETGETLQLSDYATWEKRLPQFDTFFHAIVSVPIKIQGEVIGVFGLAHVDKTQFFSPEQVSYVEQFTEIVALAIESSRLYQASLDELSERKRAQEALAQANLQLETDTRTLERRSQLLRVAAEVSRAASAILDSSQLSQQVVELVQQRFALYYVGLFLVDEAGEKAVLTAATGAAGQEMLKHGHKLELGSASMIGWCITNRRARIALDVGEEAIRFNNPLLSGTRSELALPLISHGTALGALSIQSEQEAAFSDEDIETFQTMADQLANAILNAHLYDQLEKELDERKRAEAKVRRLNADLEKRVERRTMDLKASEEKFRALAENNPLQISRFDREGRYLYINRAGKNDLLQPVDLIGKTIREIYSDPALIEMAEACIHQVFDTAQPLKTEYAQQGSHSLWSLAPEFDPDGRVISVVTTTFDITERKHMEEELHRRSLELQAANKELESFSYSVSHDLRAPLRAMDGFSRILLDDFEADLPNQGKIFLGRIREAVQQMSQLIDDMLRLSRITRAEVHFLPVNLTAMVQTITAALQTRYPNHPVRLQVAENLVVMGDEGLLRMALENLLNNAWKFSGKHSEPLVEVGKISQQGKETFFVRDNGVGFDMEYAHKLFSAFQRLHSAQEFPGTGIGLAIVQRVIHKHGGRVWAESQPDQGATFYFTL